MTVVNINHRLPCDDVAAVEKNAADGNQFMLGMKNGRTGELGVTMEFGNNNVARIGLQRNFAVGKLAVFCFQFMVVVGNWSVDKQSVIKI
jgi:hypothetical protein